MNGLNAFEVRLAMRRGIDGEAVLKFDPVEHRGFGKEVMPGREHRKSRRSPEGKLLDAVLDSPWAASR